MDGSHPTPRKPAPCPVCGRPAKRRFRPFCSSGCADIDLGRWLTGAYRIPGEPDDEFNPGDLPPDRPGDDD